MPAKIATIRIAAIAMPAFAPVLRPPPLLVAAPPLPPDEVPVPVDGLPVPVDGLPVPVDDLPELVPVLEDREVTVPVPSGPA